METQGKTLYAMGENTYGMSRFTCLGLFAPWILPLYKLLTQLPVNSIIMNLGKKNFCKKE
jgi:hypothetical protein